MIQAHQVSKIYHVAKQDVYALHNVSFTIEDGAFVVILGPSGAGKSALLNILGGIDTFDEGEILVHDQRLAKLNEQQLSAYRARQIDFVFQFYNLIPTLNVYENVALMKDLKKDILPVHQILADVGLAKHEHQFPSQLSGGEQQRVSIARALCKNPDILLCDEPTGALDSDTGKMILELLWKMCKTYHKTTIIVTHNAALAPCGDTLITLHNGSLSSLVHQDHPQAIQDVKW